METPSIRYHLVAYITPSDGIGPLTRSGVAVIRVSGQNADDCLHGMVSSLPDYRKAAIRKIYDYKSRQFIDQGIVLRFEKGKSYTAEQTVEFQVHGSVAVINAILHSLSAIPNYRQAEAGEFTRRSFLNGELSLMDAEALSDLLNAETEEQLHQANEGWSEKLQDLCSRWKQDIMQSLAHVETMIDFSDDIDEERIALEGDCKKLERIRAEMQTQLYGFERNQLVRDGLRVVLFGPPNAGKSSLLNGLAKEDVAIVSSIAGTTRDILTVPLDLDGYKVIIQDTAGIHEDATEIEQMGITRARAAVHKSALQLLIMDIADPRLREHIKQLTKEISSLSSIMLVLNKTDTISTEMAKHILKEMKQQYPSFCGITSISCLRPETLPSLSSLLSNQIQLILSNTTRDHCYVWRERQRNCLDQCSMHLNKCIELQTENLIDMQAEELRLCLKCLGELCGDVDVEDVLDIVFSEFCIGK